MLSKTWWLLTFRWLFAQNTSNNEVRKSSYLTGASLAVALLSTMLGVGALSFVRALVTGFERQLSMGVANFFGPLSYKSGWRTESEHEWVANKLNYPLYVQPKLDGLRMIAMLDIHGKVILKTREYFFAPWALRQ